jgi:hypothetical protein
VIREAKRMCYNNLLIQSDNKVKMAWRIVRRGAGKICYSDPMPSMYKIDNTLIKPSQAVDAFNNYF